MLGKWGWCLRQIGRQLWFRATIFSVLGVATALLAWAVKPYIPAGLSTRIGADAVDNVLGIIASSMLAVTTFSLSIMVSAYGSATSNVTPRATSLLDEDTTTQNALATFIGSFLFSLVGIIALSTGAYGEQGRVVMFGVTLLVIALIVWTLLRWISHLSTLGRLGQTTDRVEDAAVRALRERLARPNLGARPLPRHLPSHARPCHPDQVGYVQHIDMPALAQSLASDDARIYILAPPGTFVDLTRPLALTTGMDEADVAAVRRAFTIGRRRSFEQDPRFGVCVLSEIAQRALSAAINDPGTVIDLIGRSVRVLGVLAEPVAPVEAPDPACRRLYLDDPDIDDLMEDFYAPIVRDGAGLLEVGIRLQKALASLARLDPARFGEPARRLAARALRHADATLRLDEDKAMLRAAADAAWQRG